MFGSLQRISFADSTSTDETVEYGVPQGFVLEPLLFIMFINGISKCLQNVKVNLFSDDTLWYIETNATLKT